MKQKKLMARVLGLGLCASLLSTVTLAASGTPYTGAAADIAAPEGQVATLLVDGKATRFDNSDKIYAEGEGASVVYTDSLDRGRGPAFLILRRWGGCLRRRLWLSYGPVRE